MPVSVAHLVEHLRTQQHLTSGAALLERLGQRRAARALQAVVVLQQIGIDARAKLLLVRRVHGELSFGFGDLGAGVRFFLFDRRRFLFQILLGLLQILLLGVGVDHRLQDLIFQLADFLFGEGDLVHQGAVLVVGLDRQGLFTKLRNVLVVTLDFRFMFAPRYLVGLDRGLRLGNALIGVGQFGFDGLHLPRQVCDFGAQLRDFLLDLLQLDQLYEIRVHRENCWNFSTCHANRAPT